MNTTNYGIIELLKYEWPGAAQTARTVAAKGLVSMQDNDTPNDNLIPYGYCHCGCGQRTTIAPKTDRYNGYTKGEPRTFISGHHIRKVDFSALVPESRKPRFSADHDAWVVPLTQGLFAVIDCDIADDVGKTRWYASSTGGGIYAKRNGEYLHHLVIAKSSGMAVDHINGDTLDNRRSNLRLVTLKINARNQHIHHGRNTSGYRGVSWHTGTSKWRAFITVEGKQIHLGLFADADDAAQARDSAARQWFGDDAFLNFPVKEGRE